MDDRIENIDGNGARTFITLVVDGYVDDAGRVLSHGFERRGRRRANRSGSVDDENAVDDEDAPSLFDFKVLGPGFRREAYLQILRSVETLVEDCPKAFSPDSVAPRFEPIALVE